MWMVLKRITTCCGKISKQPTQASLSRSTRFKRFAHASELIEVGVLGASVMPSLGPSGASCRCYLEDARELEYSDGYELWDWHQETNDKTNNAYRIFCTLFTDSRIIRNGIALAMNSRVLHHRRQAHENMLTVFQNTKHLFKANFEE